MCEENKHCCLYCQHLSYWDFDMCCIKKLSILVEYPTNQAWINIRKQLLEKGLDCKDYEYSPTSIYPDMK